MGDDTYDEDKDDLLTELIDEEGDDDTRELQEPCATPNSLLPTLQKEYNALLVNDTAVEDIKSSQSVHTIQDRHRPCEGKPEMAQNWYALVYVNANIVVIIRMFIRSERTGNWHIHLTATQDILKFPYFAAAGHNNYAK